MEITEGGAIFEENFLKNLFSLVSLCLSSSAKRLGCIYKNVWKSDIYLLCKALNYRCKFCICKQLQGTKIYAELY